SETDDTGSARSLRVSVQRLGADSKWTEERQAELPAKTILIAAGTQPNTVLAREDAATFRLDGRYFQACDESGTPVTPEKAISKPAAVRVLLAMRRSEGGNEGGNEGSGARAD